MTNIAFIGAGNMASAIMGGLIENGFSAKNIYASDPSQEKLDELTGKFGINGDTNNQAVIEQADVVIVAVKPQVMELVLSPLKDA